MKKIFKILVSVIMAFALALPSTVSFAGLGGESSLDNFNDASFTNVSIVKLKADKTPKTFKLKLEDYYKKGFGKDGEEGITNLTPEDLTDLINKDVTEEENKVNLEYLNGAKFYVFRAGDDKTFKTLNDNPEKYDTVEKIIKASDKLNIYTVFSDGEEAEDIHYYVNPSSDFDGICPADKVTSTTKKDKIFLYGTTGELAPGKVSEGGNEEEEKAKRVKEGQVTFRLADFTSRDDFKHDLRENRALYWIVEDLSGNKGDASDVTATYSVPIALTLPMAKNYHTGGFFSGQGNKSKLDRVYVYPKNTVGEKVKKEKTVESERIKYTSIDNYQDISWYLQGNLPSNDFEKLTYLRFYDELNSKVAEDEKYDQIEDYLKPIDEQLKKDVIDKGFLFREDKGVEVYVKKTHPKTPEEAEIKEIIDKKYYTYNFSDDGKSVEVEFNKAKVGDKTVLDINNPDKNGGKNPIFNPGKLEKDDELTVFVKVHARYTDEGMLKEKLAEYNKKGYNNEADFDADRKEHKGDGTDTVGETGISDKDLNKFRINDFTLEYSHNPGFEEGSNKDKAEGNKYEPRVNTGGKKFIKYSSDEAIDKGTEEEDPGILKGLKDAKFYVKRTRTAKIKEDVSKEIKAVGEKYYGITEADEEVEYLALKGGKKVWVPEEALEIKNEGANLVVTFKDTDKYDGYKLYSLNSDENGLFELRGLEMSDYTAKILEYQGADKTPVQIEYAEITNDYALLEYEAPAEYQIDRNDIKFTVEEGSHLKEEPELTLKLEDMNKKELYETKIGKIKTDDGEKDTTILDQSMAIKNVKPKIPSTGGMGRLIFIIIGLIIMAVSAILYKKRKCEA